LARYPVAVFHDDHVGVFTGEERQAKKQ
jgi:hypothetical protein